MIDPSTDDENKRAEQSEFKKPDFIFIDDTQDHLKEDYQKFNHQDERRFEHAAWKSTHQPLSIRLIYFLAMLICFFIAIGMLIWTALVLVGATLLLFQNQALNQTLRKFWNFYVNISVVALGLGVAIFSPRLGLGWILIYFSLNKGTSNPNEWLNKILKRIF